MRSKRSSKEGIEARSEKKRPLGEKGEFNK